MSTLDDLELELRKLPGVRSAGFAERDDLLFVQVHVGDNTVDSSVPMQAARIAYRNSDRPVAVELVRWKTAPTAPLIPTEPVSPLWPAQEPDIDLVEESRPPTTIVRQAETRARLLAVLTFPDTEELEVHLTHASERAIGRADASHGLVAAAEATLDGLQQFTDDLELEAEWARVLESSNGHGFLVAVELSGTNDLCLHGIANGVSPVEAAARATLHALNRTLTRDLADAAVDEPN